MGGTLPELIHDIEEKGIAFGLWFEPEMVSLDSDLYRKHPEWVMQVQGRRMEMSRDEYVLVLSNPSVCEYIIKSISAVLQSCHIAYVKWDMNRNFTNMGSTYLPADRQKEQAHRYILGLYHVMETLTGLFPEVLFESCAGGGGRCDPGMLYYMPQVWISDDTDAVERLRMRYGSSLIYPPLVMGCHVSEIPNHQTGRQESLRTRTAVASLGNLGLELNLSQISEEEKRQIKEEVAFYKKVRPVVQFGMLYRLKGLQSGNEFAWMHISEDEKQILVTYVQILASPNTVSKRLRLTGLCPDAGYQEAGEMHMYTGRELMSIGLSPGKIRTDAYSRQWLFKRVEESRLLLDD